MAKEVCGVYPWAIPWFIYSDLPDEELAEYLASTYGCSYYMVDGNMYGPF